MWYDENRILTCISADEKHSLSLIDVRTAETSTLKAPGGETLSVKIPPDIAMAMNADRTKLAFWSNQFEPSKGVDHLTLNLLDLTTGERKTRLFTCYSDPFLDSYGKVYVLESEDQPMFVPYTDYISFVFFME